MIEKINYIADDGKVFDNFEDCAVYDNDCKLKNEIFRTMIEMCNNKKFCSSCPFKLYNQKDGCIILSLLYKWTE